MREIVSLHAGQCGNAIGSAFWDLLLAEHEKTLDSDPALGTFFYRDESRSGKPTLKARALLVDMECGPLNETMRGPLASLFDETQYIMDVSGAGNNFAHGHYYYGPRYEEHILEGLRRNLERCDSVQGFFLTHSLGGGTGSGVGTYMLRLLYDAYPKVTRFSTCVYPSEANDVITAPYNTTLATRALIEAADCVFPLNNSALFQFHQLEHPPNKDGSDPDAESNSTTNKRSRGFVGVNNIAARMLCNLTASVRFHGEMNVDINEIYTNLVPFPRMHFLMTALSVQIPPTATVKTQDYSRAALQRAFKDIVSNRGQLSGVSLVQSDNPRIVTTASAFLARGKVRLSEYISCVTAAQRSSLRFPSWNPDACKIGMCSTAPPGQEMSVMAVYNSSAFSTLLGREMNSFRKLFRAKAMLHHYLEYVDISEIQEAEYQVQSLMNDYQSLESGQFPPPESEIARSNPFSHANIELFPAF